MKELKTSQDTELAGFLYEVRQMRGWIMNGASLLIWFV